MTYSCMLCGSGATDSLESIHATDLIRAYRRKYDIPVSAPATTIEYLHCRHCDLRFFYPLFSGDNAFYASLSRLDWYYLKEKPEYLRATTLISGTQRVLEVGAGEGAFSRHIPHAEYIGLEFSDSAIRAARAQGVQLLRETVESHSTRNANRYDAVVSFQVLEHVPNLTGFIRGCVAALKPGGRCVFAVPNHEGICGLARNNILDLPPHHLTHWSPRALTAIGDIFGLRVVQIDAEPVSPIHVKWTRRNIWGRRIERAIRRAPSMLDSSGTGTIIDFVAAGLSYVIRPNLSLLAGHTLLACYQKQ